MKKLYILFFLVFSFIANAQIVNIPDANFKAALLSASSSNSIASTANLIYNTTSGSTTVPYYDSIDINGDGEIQVSEAQSIKWLKIPNFNIFDLTGIEAFINLQLLDCTNNQLLNVNLLNNNYIKVLLCQNNQLTSLNTSNLISLQKLICDDNQITNLDFSTNNLISLSCRNNQLVNLNVDNNNNLKSLNCEQNLLLSLSLTTNINLRFLFCSNNQINNLNLIYNTILERLICSDNLLSVLDLSQNFALTNLDCSFNLFSNFDLSQNFSLVNLNCSNNQLSSINLSQNFNLQTLDCQNNSLVDLNLSNNPNLYLILCNNNPSLISLNSKNGILIQNYNISYNLNACPSLEYICADDFNIIYFQQLVNDNNYTNCHVNTYCTFTPGGAFYEISGNTKFDYNTDGCDVTDINYSNLRFSITDGTNTGTMIANQTGNYYIPVEAGNHTVTPVLENPTYFNISPTSFVANFPTQASPFTRDFCVTANGVKSDVEVMILSTVPARPGFDATYKISYRNKGNQIENGSVSLTFDDAVLDYVSSNPSFDSSATNSYTWNYSNLQPFETREIEVIFNVNGPTETPAVNIDDILNYSTTITTSNTDEIVSDNTFTLDQTVVGSYDPNDKTCLEGETVEPSMAGEYVHYVIRFENTGTFPAQNIVVKDMIDLAKFDIATLIPLKGSHDYFTRIKDNKVEFIFENINLDFNDATNDGYVAFKIKTKSTLVIGDTFSNDANIYFDYNFPITTNTYTTTIAALSTQNFEFGSEFILYPNPAKDVLNIQSKNSLAIQSIEIYNLLGQVVLAVPNSSNTIDVSNLKTGTYFVKVNTEKGSSNTKFVKE